MTTTRQELKNRILRKLEETECFWNTRITGDLDSERNHLNISYKIPQNVDKKKSYKTQKILERKIEETIEDLSRGLTKESSGPDEHEEYRIVLTRIPMEGMDTESTNFFLERIYERIKSKYVFG